MAPEIFQEISSLHELHDEEVLMSVVKANPDHPGANVKSLQLFLTKSWPKIRYLCRLQLLHFISKVEKYILENNFFSDKKKKKPFLKTNSSFA
jgi:hypothetical protein